MGLSGVIKIYLVVYLAFFIFIGCFWYRMIYKDRVCVDNEKLNKIMILATVWPLFLIYVLCILSVRIIRDIYDKISTYYNRIKMHY